MREGDWGEERRARRPSHWEIITSLMCDLDRSVERLKREGKTIPAGV